MIDATTIRPPRARGLGTKISAHDHGNLMARRDRTTTLQGLRVARVSQKDESHFLLDGGRAILEPRPRS